MNTIHLGVLNVSGLSSNGKQTRFLNDIRSRKLDVIVAAEVSLKGSRDLLSLFNDYKKYVSPSRPGSGVEVLVLLKKNRIAEKKLIFFSDPERRLVVMDLTLGEGKVSDLSLFMLPINWGNKVLIIKTLKKT